MAETAAHLVDHVIPRVPVLPEGVVISDPASLSVRCTSRAPHPGLADRPPGHFPEPIPPFGLHSPKTPKCAETWRLEPINGPEILRFWTEISRD